MKIQITRPTLVNRQTVAPGDVVETDRKTAELLIAMRKARAADKPQRNDKKAD